MAIKVYFDEDKPYAVAETMEEVAALLRLGMNGHSVRQAHNSSVPSDVHDRKNQVSEFFLQINNNARKLLLALVKHEKGVRGEQFADETGFGSEKFGGIFGGASKIAKNAGLRIEQFVISDYVVKGSERYRFYKPGKLLLEYAEKLKQSAREGVSDL